jgi:hypothetical protein
MDFVVRERYKKTLQQNMMSHAFGQEFSDVRASL